MSSSARMEQCHQANVWETVFFLFLFFNFFLFVFFSPYIRVLCMCFKNYFEYMRTTAARLKSKWHCELLLFNGTNISRVCKVSKKKFQCVYAWLRLRVFVCCCVAIELNWKESLGEVEMGQRRRNSSAFKISQIRRIVGRDLNGGKNWPQRVERSVECLLTYLRSEWEFHFSGGPKILIEGGPYHSNEEERQ